MVCGAIVRSDSYYLALLVAVQVLLIVLIYPAVWLWARVPLGVFGMVYESRPNVTIEAASLAIKSGNACILRGGSEALASNIALGRIVQAALAEAGLPPDAVQLVETRDRAAVAEAAEVLGGVEAPRDHIAMAAAL